MSQPLQTFTEPNTLLSTIHAGSQAEHVGAGAALKGPELRLCCICKSKS